jgi:antitoxin component of RelBE/YafQ-DinJ toxin-antitoxin module
MTALETIEVPRFGPHALGAFRSQEDPIDRIWRFAEKIASAQFIQPQLRGDVSTIFYMLATAEEMGLTWTHAIRSIYLGKSGGVGMKGEMILALLLARGFTVDFQHQKEPVIGCTCTITRPNGHTFSRSFTMADAASIRTSVRDPEQKTWWTLADRIHYVNYPEDCCQWRALTRCARIAAPDVIGGIYLPEELDEASGEDAHAEEPTQPEPAMKVGEKSTATEPTANAAAHTQPDTALSAKQDFESQIAVVTQKLGLDPKTARRVIGKYFAGYLGIPITSGKVEIPKDRAVLADPLQKLMEVLDREIENLRTKPWELGQKLSPQSEDELANLFRSLHWPEPLQRIAQEVMQTSGQTPSEFAAWVRTPIAGTAENEVSIAQIDPQILSEFLFPLYLLVKGRAFEAVDFAVSRGFHIADTLREILRCSGRPIENWDPQFAGKILDSLTAIDAGEKQPAPTTRDDDWATGGLPFER